MEQWRSIKSKTDGFFWIPTLTAQSDDVCLGFNKNHNNTQGTYSFTPSTTVKIVFKYDYNGSM
jgi:hypothetical protein